MAALLVVIYHFMHFEAYGQDPQHWSVDRGQLPFPFLLGPVYENGWMAVDLFFVISGFIFSFLYTSRIHSNAISPYKFFVLRFSRLYPLHVATLCVVIVLQYAYKLKIGSYFVVPYNDFHQLLLNILLVQSWGIGKGASFNGPSWSVSIEVLLYVAFFIFCRYRFGLGMLGGVCLVAFGIVAQIASPIIGRGLTGYFSGVLVYRIYTSCARRVDAEVVAKYALVLTFSFCFICLGLSYAAGAVYSENTVFPIIYCEYITKLVQRFVMIVGFPLIVFTLAMAETCFSLRWTQAEFLGSISYSSYLLHFPLQLVFAVMVAYGFIDLHLLVSGYGLLTFIVSLLPLSWIAHRYFEFPAQRILRRLLIT